MLGFATSPTPYIGGVGKDFGKVHHTLRHGEGFWQMAKWQSHTTCILIVSRKWIIHTHKLIQHSYYYLKHKGI